MCISLRLSVTNYQSSIILSVSFAVNLEACWTVLNFLKAKTGTNEIYFYPWWIPFLQIHTVERIMTKYLANISNEKNEFIFHLDNFPVSIVQLSICNALSIALVISQIYIAIDLARFWHNTSGHINSLTLVSLSTAEHTRRYQSIHLISFARFCHSPPKFNSISSNSFKHSLA